MAIDLPTLIALSMALVSTVGLLGLYFREISSIKGDIERIDQKVSCVPDMQRDVGKLSADAETFWRILEPSLSNIIHSPTHKRRDDLVDLFVAGKLGETRLRELRVYLKDLLHEEPNESVKHLAGALLLGRVEAQLTILSAQQRLEEE
jgi:hypothetical protein